MSTLDDFAAGPEPYRPDYGPPGDCPSLDRYHHDWYLWRALRRDAQLTDAERDASFRVLAERLGYPGVGLWD